jgi:hypothetical protein
MKLVGCGLESAKKIRSPVSLSTKEFRDDDKCLTQPSDHPVALVMTRIAPNVKCRLSVVIGVVKRFCVDAQPYCWVQLVCYEAVDHNGPCNVT